MPTSLTQTATSKLSKKTGKPRVSPVKIQKVKELQDLVDRYRVLAIANIDNIGSRQMTSIRKSLRGQVVIKVAKNTLFKRALQNATKKKPGIDRLIDHLSGNLAFLFTDMDPFKLSLFLIRNKSKAPARVGQIAPKDIVVPAGNTGFQPGPVITQLQNVGIKTRIQDGTIHIAQDTVIAAAGEPITLNMVIVLSRLKIEPMEIALELKHAYDNGIIISGEMLKIDLDKTRDQLVNAYRETFALTMEISYASDDTIRPLIVKAHQQALELAIEAKVANKDSLPLLLAKAQVQASAVGVAVRTIDPNATPQGLPEFQSQARQIKPEKKEKEDNKEESPEAEVGLDSLFG
ncbi:MAG: 50S ribosomal protein L10 [Candidatus Ranarchaeia archaeon]